MSDLDNAINSINASAAKAENTATFLDDMSTFDDQSSVTNPNNGQTVASIPKQVKDRTDELFTAAESDINQAVSDAEQSATDAQDAADSIGRYQGLWPDTGGSADKGDTYQTQVSGTPTGQYFTALQNTTVDPIGDNVNWRAVISNQSLGDLTNYQTNSVADMIAGITAGSEAVQHSIGQVWSINGRWRVKSLPVSSITDFEPVGDVFGNDFGIALGGITDENPFQLIREALPNGAVIKMLTGEYEITPAVQIQQLPFTVFDWQNSVVKSRFTGGSVFYLDCRSSSSFQNGAGHKNLRLGSNNNFNDATREYDHFYKIDGGWAQSIVWDNIVAEPNLAIKSGLHFDLTGAGEVGVPDTSTIKGINFLKAYGTSAAISAEGTSGEGARIGQINAKDFLFGAIYSLDYDGVTSTGDCSAIYLKDCGWGAGEFSNLYGNPSVIKGNGVSKIDGAKLSSFYQEIDNFLNAQLISNGTALINGVTLQNCIVDRPEAYIDTLVIATKPGDRRMIDAVMIDTDITKPRLTDPRGDWNLIDSNTINARSGSRGGSVEPIKFSESIDKTDDWHTKISVPKSTEVGNSYPKYRTRIRDLRINSDTDTLVFTIPGDFIEMADTIRVRLDSQSGVGTYSVRVGGFNGGSEIVTQAVDSSAGDSYVELDISLIGNASKRGLPSTPCKSYKKVVQSAAVLQDSLDGQTYLAGTDLTFTIRTTGSTTDVRINVAVVDHIKSDFVTYT